MRKHEVTDGLTYSHQKTEMWPQPAWHMGDGKLSYTAAHSSRWWLLSVYIGDISGRVKDSAALKYDLLNRNIAGIGNHLFYFQTIREEK